MVSQFKRLLGWRAIVVALLATAFAGAGTAAAATPLRISFYGDIGNPVGSGNPLLVHPSRLLLHEDGSWAVTGLHWTGWGTSITSATGYSLTNDCTPSCATGASLWTPAKLTLSSPGTVLGREVYRCFRVTVPSPQSGPRGCIGRVGSLYVYDITWGRPSVTSGAPGWFSWPTAHLTGESATGVVVCALSAAAVACSSTLPAAPYGEIVSLASEGAATICVIPSACGTGIADGPAALLPFGSLMTQGPFRCSSAASGITCVVTKTGLGFRFNASGITLVG